jgi:hypothetical protein
MARVPPLQERTKRPPKKMQLVHEVEPTMNWTAITARRCWECTAPLLPDERKEGLCCQCHEQQRLPTFIKQNEPETGGGNQMETKKQKPEKKFRVGAVSATIWKRTHTTKDGQPFDRHQVSLDRTYKDRNDQWQSTNSYDTNDVPKAILALSNAYAYLMGNNGGRDKGPAGEVIEEQVE